MEKPLVLACRGFSFMGPAGPARPEPGFTRRFPEKERVIDAPSLQWFFCL